jgi:VCBS repeat-containing protein
MNQYYKSIWNETLGTSVAAAETAAVTGQTSPGPKARRVPVRAHAGQLALEQRIVFDAALPATLVEIQSESSSGQDALYGDLEPLEVDETAPAPVSGTDEAVTTNEVEEAAEDRAADVPATAEEISLEEGDSAGVVSDESPAEAVEPERVEIIFVESSVEDIQAYLDQHPGEVHVLDADRDGVEQMAEILYGRTGVDAIHIVSHGDTGQLDLGTATLNSQTLEAEYLDEMAVIAAALSPDADLLLYGCDVAATQEGADFVTALADATGADVAASTDTTGSSELGGDWNLEFQTSNAIETQALDGTDWQGELAAPVAPDAPDLTSGEFGTATYSNMVVMAADPTAVHPGEYAVFSNIGTFDGQAVDLVITFVSTTGGGAGSLRFFSGPSLSILAQGYAAGVENMLTFEYFIAGTNTPIAFSGVMNFSDIDDIDQGGPTVAEAVILPSTVFTDILLTAGTTLNVSEAGGLTTVEGTVESGAYAGSGGDLTDLSFSAVIENVNQFNITLRNGGTNTGFTINSTDFNFIPGDAADNDQGVTDEDSVLVVSDPALGVLANDFDADGDSLSVSQVEGSPAGVGTPVTLASGAIVQLNADGTYTYDPNGVYDYLNPGDSTTDQFEYQVSDGNGGVDLGTVTITINGLNDPPVAVDDAITVTEDTPFTSVVDLDANDTDLDGDALTVVPGTFPTAQGGTIVIAANGSYTYTPPASYNGPDSVNYTVTDGTASDVGTLNISVGPGNDPPVASNDLISTPQDLPFAGHLPVASDPEGDPITYTQTTPPSHGTVVIETDGSYLYIPEPGYSGSDSFTYTVSDGLGGSNTYTVDVSITDAPETSAPPTATTPEDTPLVFSSANGNGISIADPDNTNAVVELKLEIPGDIGSLQLSGSAGLISVSGNGSNQIILTGTITSVNAALNGLTLTPTADYNSAIATDLVVTLRRPLDLGFVNGGFENPDFVDLNAFHAVNESLVPGWDTSASDNTIEIWDSGHSGVEAFEGDQSAELNANLVSTLSQTFTPSIAGGDLELSFAHRGRSGDDTMNVTAIDLGADGVLGGGDDTVLFSQDYTTGNTAWQQYQTNLGPATGNAVIVQFNSITAAGGDPTFGNFLDAISIAGSATTTDIVQVAISPVQDTVTDNLSTNEDTPITFNVLTGTGGASADNFEGSPTVSGNTNPSHGSLVLGANGEFTYTPDLNYTGPDSFTYTVTSPSGVTETETVNINVAGANNPPVAVDDAITVAEDTPFTSVVDLDANDTDLDGDALTVVAGTFPTAQGGTIVIAANGSYTYTPPANYTGADSVDYTVTDGTATDVGTLNITVTPINAPPVLDLDGDDSSGASGGGTTVGPNLVVNGDFSAGSSGFSTDYSTGADASILFNEGTYFIGDASVNWAPGGSDMVTADPFGSTTGQMMYVNGSPTAGDIYWSQTLTVEPNTDYEFSVWATNVNNWAGPTGDGSADPQFELRIDGAVVASGQLSYLTAGVWEQFAGTWNSGAATSVTLAMSTASGATQGNDLAVTGFALNTVEVSPNPNYETTFTENGPAVSIADLDSSITDVDDTHIESATVVLTNAQAGDVLSVGGSLPAGIAASVDTSVPGQVTVTLTGSATLAQYESALEALRFENTSDDPDTTDRILEVVVNDGSSNSNTAITTIHVVPVNDLPDEVSPPPVPAPPVPGPASEPPAPAPLPETPLAPRHSTPVPFVPPHVPGVMPTPPRVHVSVAVSEASTESGLSATPLGNLMLNSPLLGEALAQASDGLLFANNTHGEDLGLIRERGFGEMETYSPALYVQHAVRHQPITTDPSLWVQHAVRASQLESQVRSAMIDANNSATPGYSTLIDPFALGAPRPDGSPLHVAETVIPGERHEAVAQVALEAQVPVAAVKTANDPSAEKAVAKPRAAEGLRNQLQRFAKNRVSSARPITRSTVSG